MPTRAERELVSPTHSRVQLYVRTAVPVRPASAHPTSHNAAGHSIPVGRDTPSRPDCATVTVQEQAAASGHTSSRPGPSSLERWKIIPTVVRRPPPCSANIGCDLPRASRSISKMYSNT
eukprot:4692617-Prymnesium_polylepis.2